MSQQMKTPTLVLDSQQCSRWDGQHRGLQRV